ncbi:MAG: hypothetical protein IPL84_09150 [Chitinophagaceae bacterium]|nr:hypothetical protein [Chitinophagaceae bacterium]
MIKKLLLPFFLIGTLAMMFVMAKNGAILKTPEAPNGILNLEFAYNTAKAAPIINSWASINHADVITAAKINTYWDFLFLFFYAGFLFLACKKIAQKINGGLSKAGHLIAKGALLAGFLDVLENAGMLLTLNQQGSSTIAFFTTFVSVIKWGLALMAVLYVLTGLIVLAYRKIK